jgi:hypothetical protein
MRTVDVIMILSLGDLLSQTSCTLRGDMNLYAYVANNPVDYTDPTETSAAIQ